jgi:hypothetical protein
MFDINKQKNGLALQILKIGDFFKNEVLRFPYFLHKLIKTGKHFTDYIVYNLQVDFIIPVHNKIPEPYHFTS